MLTERLQHIYRDLLAHFGPRHWWPATTPFEMVVGAILTQNTAWRNVEQAILRLKNRQVLSPGRLAALERTELEELIRPAGYFRQKAARLQDLAIYLEAEWQGDVRAWCAGPLTTARARLLERPGIGPETADSILLYAGQRPSFVVDAYTRRIFGRLGLLRGGESYAQVRALFMSHLPHEVDLFNEYHALIVELAKTFCRKRSPRCAACPLQTGCRHGRLATKAGGGNDLGDCFQANFWQNGDINNGH